MKRRFAKVNIEIANLCNLQCSFCPAVIRSKAMMSLPLFDKIIAQVAPLTEQVCFHLMGEPLVHPQLADFVESCHRHDARIFFVTNGVLLREPLAKLLLHPAFRQVNFSLHSFPDNFEDRDPTQYLDRIFAFTERAFVERPDLYINYRLWNLASAQGANAKNQTLLQRVEQRFASTVATAVDVTQRKSFRLKERLYLHFDTEFAWPRAEGPLLGLSGTCYGLSSHFGILVDGTVVPCCLDKEGAIPLGNVANTPLTEILESDRAKKILAGFQRKTLVESLCQRCQYIERFQ